MKSAIVNTLSCMDSDVFSVLVGLSVAYSLSINETITVL